MQIRGHWLEIIWTVCLINWLNWNESFPHFSSFSAAALPRSNRLSKATGNKLWLSTAINISYFILFQPGSLKAIIKCYMIVFFSFLPKKVSLLLIRRRVFWPFNPIFSCIVSELRGILRLESRHHPHFAWLFSEYTRACVCLFLVAAVVSGDKAA